MVRVLIVCCLLGLLVKDTETVFILKRVPCVVDRLWKHVNDGWFVTTGSYMSRFLTRYQKTNDKEPRRGLNLYMKHFINGGENFVKDFAECDMTERFAMAYFRSLNMFDNWLLMRLTIEDLDVVVDEIDRHTGNLRLGFVTNNQFKNGLTDNVFRSLPLSLLYVDTMGENKILKHTFIRNMDKDAFIDIHKAMDTNDNGEVTRTEMGKFWSNKNYDTKSSGRDLFDKLDYQKLKYLNVTHWEAVFDDLNCVSKPEDKITHLEFIQLDLIQHGDRVYPSKERCLCSDPRR